MLTSIVFTYITYISQKHYCERYTAILRTQNISLWYSFKINFIIVVQFYNVFLWILSVLQIPPISNFQKFSLDSIKTFGLKVALKIKEILLFCLYNVPSKKLNFTLLKLKNLLKFAVMHRLLDNYFAGMTSVQ